MRALEDDVRDWDLAHGDARPAGAMSVVSPEASDAARVRLVELELTVARREQELAAFTLGLDHLQSRYLSEMGELYAELSALEVEVAEAEIRAGLRPPVEADDTEDAENDTAPAGASGCSHGSATPEGLKRVFRDLAKAIHPDLATDEAARYRRHSLMAEANRAYAERDEDRLRLLMRAWERSPEAVVGDDPGATAERVARRAAQLEARLLEIEAAFADLEASAIHRLKVKVDEAAARGWSLMAEMALQAKREIARAKSRLAALEADDGRRRTGC